MEQRAFAVCVRSNDPSAGITRIRSQGWAPCPLSRPQTAPLVQSIRFYTADIRRGRRLFAEVFDISVDGVPHDGDRLCPPTDLIDGGILVFKALIYREEMPHFLKNVRRELVNIGILIIIRVVIRDGDDLFIVTTVVDHRDHTDRERAAQGQRLQRLGAKQQHIQRVVIIAVGARNKAVVGGIVGRGIQNTVEDDKPGFLEMAVSPEQAPDEPTYVTISFEKGVPVAVDGKKMGGVEMIELLNDIGGKNGIGLADIVENRLVGMKSRGVYENPAGSILYKAHEVLETICLDRETQHYKALVAQKFAEVVYFGQWFTPLREALSAFVDKTQENVTGDVKLKLYKGNMINAGVTSPYSLYSEDFATFDKDEVYNQKDSAGFINLFGLPIKVRAILEEQRKAKKD